MGNCNGQAENQINIKTKKIYVAAGRMQRFNGLSWQFKVGPIYIKFYN